MTVRGMWNEIVECSHATNINRRYDEMISVGGKQVTPVTGHPRIVGRWFAGQRPSRIGSPTPSRNQAKARAEQ